MSNLFNLDNPIFSIINKIVDIVLLSIVYTLICIPIFTIGPATTALYYTVVKNIRKERSYPFREFFKSFKDNFKQGLGLTIIFIVVYLILYVDIKFVQHSLTGTKQSVFMGIFIGLTVLAIIVNLYVFPYLSRFEITVKQLLKNCFYLAIRHLPSTLVLAVITGASLLLSYLFFPIGSLIIPGLSILLQSLLIERIFKKYMPEKLEDAVEQGVDEWYLD